MKHLLLVLSLNLYGMSPREMSPRDPIPKRFQHPKPCKNVSFDKDMNLAYLPNQVQLEDDIHYLDIAYTQMRDRINDQSRRINVLNSEVKDVTQALHNTLTRLEAVERRLNKLPWYKRMNCFKRNR